MENDEVRTEINNLAKEKGISFDEALYEYFKNDEHVTLCKKCGNIIPEDELVYIPTYQL